MKFSVSTAKSFWQFLGLYYYLSTDVRLKFRPVALPVTITVELNLPLFFVGFQVFIYQAIHISFKCRTIMM